MSTPRQLPLFPTQPDKPDDLNRHTPLKHTYALFQRFLKDEGKSEHTVNAFTSDLNLLAENTGEDTPIGEYKTETLNEFLRWLEVGRGVPCSRKSYARRVTTLKVFFKWLKSLGAIPYDPAEALIQRSGPAPLSYVLSRDEVNAAFAFAQTMTRKGEYDTRPTLLFWLLLDTGIKKSETMRLTPADIDRSNPQLPVLTVRSKTRKVFKERRIDLDPDWLAVFDEYLAQYKRKKDTIFDCTARNLEYILADVGVGAGVEERLSFEIMRWTCMVRDTRNGMDTEMLREKMGLSPVSWQETSSKVSRLLAMQLEDEARV